MAWSLINTLSGQCLNWRHSNRWKKGKESWLNIYKWMMTLTNAFFLNNKKNLFFYLIQIWIKFLIDFRENHTKITMDLLKVLSSIKHKNIGLLFYPKHVTCVLKLLPLYQFIKPLSAINCNPKWEARVKPFPNCIFGIVKLANSGLSNPIHNWGNLFLWNLNYTFFYIAYKWHLFVNFTAFH